LKFSLKTDSSFLIAICFIAVALTGLLMDRVLGVGFFDAGAGGDPVLYEHLF
jgi:heme/copper-type cytochrome/quinol oxidase subunit 1